MAYIIRLSKQARKQIPWLRAAGLRDNVNALLEVLRLNPFLTPPSYEKLTGDFKGLYSRRINRQHRLVYAVDEALKEVHILSMWSHYE